MGKQTLYYAVFPQKWDIDLEFVDNGMKNIRVYDIDTQTMKLRLVAEIEAVNESSSEFEIQAWLDEEEDYQDQEYNFESL